MITADDVVTVVQEEAEEDVLRLAGVGDEEITDGVLKKTKEDLVGYFTKFIYSNNCICSYWFFSRRY